MSHACPCSKTEFQTKVIDSKDAIVLDCFADWCGPSMAIAPKFDELANQYPDVKFYKIDVDNLSDVGGELGVREMPTFFLFNNGKKISEVVGVNRPALEAGIRNMVVA